MTWIYSCPRCDGPLSVGRVSGYCRDCNSEVYMGMFSSDRKRFLAKPVKTIDVRPISAIIVYTPPNKKGKP